MNNSEEEIIVSKIFTKSGINCITEVKIKIDSNKTDIDVFGVYKNVIFLVECVGTDKLSLKVKKAKSDFDTIINDFDKVINILKKDYKEFYRINKIFLNSRDRKFAKLIINFERETRSEVESHTRNLLNVNGYGIWTLEEMHYFERISNCTYEHCKYEIMSSLEIKPSDVDSIDQPTKPYLAYGYNIGIDVYLLNLVVPVTDLLKMSKIIRLNNTDNAEGYQRLLDRKKLVKMREFLLSDKKSYYPNNLICVLHKDCSLDKNIIEEFKPKQIPLKNWLETRFKDNLFLVTLPNTYDSFEIIDGQHRLFSYAQTSEYLLNEFENPQKEKKRNKELDQKATKTSLNVTSIFSKTLKPVEAYRLFYEINTKQTRIKPEDIIDLAEKFDKNKPEAQASILLRKLNANGILHNKIKINYWQSDRIKRTSLITYSGLKDIFITESKTYKIFFDAYCRQSKIKDYVTFCFILINNYFTCLKKLVEKKHSAEYSKMKYDIRGKDYYLFSAVFIGALIRLLRHFISGNDKAFKITSKISDVLKSQTGSSENINIENAELQNLFKKGLEEIVNNLNFKREEFEKKKNWGFNKWAFIEKDLFNLIRGKYKNFGQKDLLRK